MTYSDFSARWLKSGGAEHANYGLFLLAALALLRMVEKENAYAA